MGWEDKIDVDKELASIQVDEDWNVIYDKEESSLYKDFINRYNFLSGRAYNLRWIHHNTDWIWKLEKPINDLVSYIYDSHLMCNVPPYVIRLISDENLMKFNEDIRQYLSSFIFVFQYIHYEPNRDIRYALSKEARKEREKIYNENRQRRIANKTYWANYDKLDNSWINEVKQNFQNQLKENHPKIKFSTSMGESKFIEQDFLWYLGVVIRSDITTEWQELPLNFFFVNEAYYKNTHKQDFTEMVFRRLKKFFTLLESKYMNILDENMYFEDVIAKNTKTSSALIEELNKTIIELQRPWELTNLNKEIDWLEEPEEWFDDVDIDTLFI